MRPRPSFQPSWETRRIATSHESAPSILIVDPDPVSVEELSLYLTEARCNVVSCADGVECLLQLGRQSFDLVLLEVDLPILDGCTLVEAVSHKWVDAEVLLMTALSARELAARFPRCDPRECLFKPLSREALLARVTHALHVAEDGHASHKDGPPLHSTRRWLRKPPQA